LSAVTRLMRGSVDFATLLTFTGGSLIVVTSFREIQQERCDEFAAIGNAQLPSGSPLSPHWESLLVQFGIL